MPYYSVGGLKLYLEYRTVMGPWVSVIASNCCGCSFFCFSVPVLQFISQKWRQNDVPSAPFICYLFFLLWFLLNSNMLETERNGTEIDPVAVGASGRAVEADGEGRAADDGRVSHQPHEDCQRLLPVAPTGEYLVVT